MSTVKMYRLIVTFIGRANDIAQALYNDKTTATDARASLLALIDELVLELAE